MLKSNTITLLEKLNAKKTRINNPSIVYHEKTNTFPNETIRITPKYVVHFHGHRNKMDIYQYWPGMWVLAKYQPGHQHGYHMP
jgi:hypothetical protein